MKRLIILFLMVILVTILGASEKIGLALSGGGARGFAHIGMLKVIDEVGLPVDAVSGTSIGAVIGALYSMGYRAAEIESLCVSVDWKQLFDDSINREDLSVSQKRWAPYGNFYFTINRGLIPEIPSGFIPGQRIDELMFRLFYRASDISNFNDLPIPFRCVATNLITGEEKTFSSGSLSEAVRASMSIPSIFQPYRMDGQLYIDGGISQNLPADLLVDMGVNHCIGLKVNSKLRDKDDLTNIIKVLDQTINIGITTKVNQVIDECGILIEPDLSEYNSMDFDKIEEIIVAGEKAAREHIDRLRELASLRKTEPYEKHKLVETSEKLGFERIDIKGNQYLSSSKVKEYLGMNTTKSYTSNQILRHAEDAFNFELFDNIYPAIRKSDHGRILEIHVNEKARKSLALNFTYNQDDKLTAGVVFKCTNLLQKNSKLLAEIKLGGKQSLNVDYEKNFGNNWGVYFRLFPYIEESKLYFYNDEHEKTGSVRSLEYGSTGGVGMFARKFMIVEGYAFTYNTRLYRDISYEEVSGKDFTSSGLGLKFYHESLDDYIFPMKGSQFLAKLSVAEKGVASDATYKKFRMTFRTGIPVLPSISVFYRFEYGSYFKQMDVVQFDPFYIGGMDNFLGYQRSEISAPFYKINTFTLRVEPIRNLFCEYRLAGLNYADSDIWKPFQNLVFGGGAVLGYRSHFGPVRIGAGLTEDRSMNYFLSIGYDYDIFMFSRR